jgi:hypothetical protein
MSIKNTRATLGRYSIQRLSLHKAHVDCWYASQSLAQLCRDHAVPRQGGTPISHQQEAVVNLPVLRLVAGDVAMRVVLKAVSRWTSSRWYALARLKCDGLATTLT